jgi:hypothetical protein
MYTFGRAMQVPSCVNGIGEKNAIMNYVKGLGSKF